MHASVNMGCQGKSGPGKIHEVILVMELNSLLKKGQMGRALPGAVLQPHSHREGGKTEKVISKSSTLPVCNEMGVIGKLML